MLVAHHWQTPKGAWYLRVARNMNTVIFGDE
jgi:hypothetical protein